MEKELEKSNCLLSYFQEFHLPLYVYLIIRSPGNRCLKQPTNCYYIMLFCVFEMLLLYRLSSFDSWNRQCVVQQLGHPSFRAQHVKPPEKFLRKKNFLFKLQPVAETWRESYLGQQLHDSVNCRASSWTLPSPQWGLPDSAAPAFPLGAYWVTAAWSSYRDFHLTEYLPEISHCTLVHTALEYQLVMHLIRSGKGIMF